MRLHAMFVALSLLIMLGAGAGIGAGAGARAGADETNDQPIRLTLLRKGAMPKAGDYMSQQTAFSSTAPEEVKKAPADLASPGYGVIAMGEKGVLFILDEPEGGAPRLFVDSNRNGDLTDDPAAEWKEKRTSRDGKETVMWDGSAMVELAQPSELASATNRAEPVLVNLCMYRFDKSDPARASYRNLLFYYRDYGYEGVVSLAGKTMKAMLLDDLAKGNFAPATPDKDDQHSGVRLLLDVNGNGKFDARGEAFDVTRPFNIGGTTYEFADMARNGSSFRIVKSAKSVAEIPTPPELSAGMVIPAFSATDTGGKKVHVPGDYKGKVLLIDFWATWCGPCMTEMPNVVKAYAAFHSRGFEILGISLDTRKTITRMPEVMEKAKMTWRQVADGKGWDAEIGNLFAIDSIPATILIDGTTGKVLATNLQGAALEKAIAAALEKAEMAAGAANPGAKK